MSIIATIAVLAIRPLVKRRRQPTPGELHAVLINFKLKSIEDGQDGATLLIAFLLGLAAGCVVLMLR